MEEWPQDYVDLVVPGFIEIEPDGMGSFQFGTVSRGVDGSIRTIAGLTFFEWIWWGHSDNDEGCGRGWARIENEKLVGRIFIYASDRSGFVATRDLGRRTPAKSRSPRV